MILEESVSNLEDYRILLKAYLLGDISDSRLLDFVEQYFTDKALYEELQAVEDELLDQYVRGLLPLDEQEKFARYLKRLPDGQQRVNFAKALHQAVVADKTARAKAATAASQATVTVVEPSAAVVESPTSQTPALETAATSPSFWQSLAAFWQRPLWQLSLAAGLVVAFLGLFWLMIYNQKIRHDNHELRDQLVKQQSEEAQRQEQINKMEKTLQTTGEQLQSQTDELERERQRSDEQAQQIASLRAEPSPVDEWRLEPSTRKALGSPDEVTLRRNTKFVHIKIPLGSDEPPGNYRAIMKTLDGQVVLQNDKLPVPDTARRKTIFLRVDAKKITTTVYKLMLIAPDNTAFEYFLKVVKR